jgi:hypothetical protein
VLLEKPIAPTAEEVEDAAERCWEGERRCPAASSCPFDAVRLYVERTARISSWPVSAVTDDPTPEGRREALASGPYGRCVYRCDNDVADHQVAVLEFANGAEVARTSLAASIESHRLAFAAERSRTERRLVELTDGPGGR